jgi:hypothetical protein
MDAHEVYFDVIKEKIEEENNDYATLELEDLKNTNKMQKLKSFNYYKKKNYKLYKYSIISYNVGIKFNKVKNAGVPSG